MSRVQEDTEERVPQPPIDDLMEDCSGLANMERLVPLDDCFEIRPDESIDIVLDLSRKFRGVFDYKPGPTVEGAPNAECHRESVSPLDSAVARAQQPIRGSLAGRQHQVTGERHAVPFEELNGLALTKTGLEPEQQPAHSVGGMAGGVFERGQLFDFVDHPQTGVGINQQIDCVLNQAVRSNQAAHLVDDISREVELVGSSILLPTDHTDAASRYNALLAEDLCQRPGSVARLARQTEILEHMAAHRHRSGTGRPPTLITHQDGWVTRGPQHQQRFLEAGIEPGQVREVGTVLPIRPDQEAIPAPLGSKGPEPANPGGIHTCRDLRHLLRHAEVGQLHPRQLSYSHGGLLTRYVYHGIHGSGSLAPRVMVLKVLCSSWSHGPVSPSGHWMRISARSAVPSPK